MKQPHPIRRMPRADRIWFASGLAVNAVWLSILLLTGNL